MHSEILHITSQLLIFTKCIFKSEIKMILQNLYKIGTSIWVNVVHIFLSIFPEIWWFSSIVQIGLSCLVSCLVWNVEIIAKLGLMCYFLVALFIKLGF